MNNQWVSLKKGRPIDAMQSPTAHAGCVSDNAHACHSHQVPLQPVRSGNIAKVIRFFNFKVVGLFLYSRSSWKSSTKWTIRKSSSKLKHGTVNSTGQTENRRRHRQGLCDTVWLYRLLNDFNWPWDLGMRISYKSTMFIVYPYALSWMHTGGENNDNHMSCIAW